MSTFEGGALVQFRRDAVFRTQRDHLADAVGLVEDVELVVKSRQESVGRVELVNVWRVTAPIPAIVASVVKPHMLVWQDVAIWTDADHTCRWSIEAPFFPHLRCGGITRFEEASRGRATRVTLQGELAIDPRAVPVPTDVAQRALARTVEELVAALFPLNLRRVTDAVSSLLSDAGHPHADRAVSGFVSAVDDRTARIETGDGLGDPTTRRLAGRDER